MATKKKAAKPAKKGKTSPKKPVANISVRIRPGAGSGSGSAPGTGSGSA